MFYLRRGARTRATVQHVRWPSPLRPVDDNPDPEHLLEDGKVDHFTACPKTNFLDPIDRAWKNAE